MPCATTCGPTAWSSVENCQIGVFLADASPRGRVFLDRALYLPEAWTADAARREAGGVPEDVAFATQGELAQAMLARAFAAAVPAAWVTGDEISGNDGVLPRWLEGAQRPYVLAVARSHPVWPEGLQVRVAALVAGLPQEAWQRIDVGAGSKGPRVYDRAWARLPSLRADGWAQWLLIRRAVAKPNELASSRAYGREEVTMAELARVAGPRWAIEAGVERAKGEVGLDQYEVRRGAGWHRHITLWLLAHACLEVTRAAASEAQGG